MYEEQYGENAYRCYGLKGESVFETFMLLIFFVVNKRNGAE